MSAFRYMQAYDACVAQNHGKEFSCGEALSRAYQCGKRGDLSRAQQYLDASRFSLCQGRPELLDNIKDVIIDPELSETSRYAGKWSMGLSVAFEDALNRSDLGGQVDLIKDMVPCLKSDHTKPYPNMAQSHIADAIAQWHMRESAACNQVAQATGEDLNLDGIAKEISDVAPAVFANSKHYPQLKSITFGAMREMGIAYEERAPEPVYVAQIDVPEVSDSVQEDRAMAF